MKLEQLGLPIALPKRGPTCQRCYTHPHVCIMIAPVNGEMRETKLCRSCRDDWRSWRQLIYGCEEIAPLLERT